MNPNEITVSAQTGQAAPRTQGASMIWKQLLKPFLFFLVLSVVLFALDCWAGKNQELGSHEFMLWAVTVIVLSMGWVGHDELKRAGYRKILGVVNSLMFVLGNSAVILSLIHKHPRWKMTWWGFEDAYLFILLFVLIAALFPLSLYLNRKEAKSTLQQISNAL
jgi:cation transport ATPase